MIHVLYFEDTYFSNLTFFESYFKSPALIVLIFWDCDLIYSNVQVYSPWLETWSASILYLFIPNFTDSSQKFLIHTELEPKYSI